MKVRSIAVSVAVVTAFVVAAAGVAVFQLPADRAPVRTVVVPADEQAATIAALKPPKRARPVVAIIGANDGTETTDFLLPYGVLKRSGVVDVVAVATKPGPITMMPSLTIVPDTTVAEFDQRAPDGADYVIVPALHNSADPDVRAFILAQAKRGAKILGICDGTLVLENAGLLTGHRATGHWFAIGSVAARNPTMRWVRDRRYVIDGNLGTTTGVSASLPLSLALVEAVAGHERARELADEVGAAGWGLAHDSGHFRLTRTDAFSVVTNMAIALLARDTIRIRVDEGDDLIALAFTADAYGRTFRSRAVVVGDRPITTREGLRVLPDAAGSADAVELPEDTPPALALDVTIADIAARYGESTADFVRTQLEDARHTAGN